MNTIYQLTAFEWILYTWLAIAVVTFVSLFFRTAPYGRYTQSGWGPSLPSRLGWILMEAPSALLFFLFWYLSDARSWASLSFLVLWELHYFYRAFWYPLRLPNARKPMPLAIPLMGASFNLVNASLNGYWLFFASQGYADAWITEPVFLFGAGLFFLGMAINKDADNVLLSLRRPGETGYRIPEGGLFRLVSCPNYLGEMIEWLGWAMATWSLAGLTFAIWTIANLLPRAISHHRWYQEQFPEYPRERKAIIPFVW